MHLIEIIILAIVQGLTEFLPISSSGHLVISAALLQAWGDRPLPDVLEVNIVLHLGTLFAILVFYARRVLRLLGEDRRVAMAILVGTIPAVVVGLPLEHFAPEILECPLLAGLMLPVTGALLIWASRIEQGNRPYTELGYGHALLIGIFQAAAILPGISRSGATIASGLFVGMDRTSSATFAFLLALPVIAGAGLLKVLDLMKQTQFSTSWTILAAGMILSFLVGLISLTWLLNWIERGKLAYFAYWCIPVGIAVVAWQLWPA